jgi:hypothetical protein
MARTGRHLLPLLALVACAPRNGGVMGDVAATPPSAAPSSSASLPPPAPGTAIVDTAPAAAPDGGAPADVPPGKPVPLLLRPEFGVTTDPTNPPPPISGGTLALLAGRTLAVASDPDRDHVVVADLAAWKVAFDIALRPHDEPGRVVEGPAGTAFVALRRGGAVVTIDTGTGTITERRPVCSAPRGLAYDASTQLLHVACAGGELVSLPAVGGPEARRLALDGDLRDVVVSGSDLVVSRFRNAELLTVSAAGVVTGRRRPIVTGTKSFEAAVAWRMRALADGSIVVVHQGGFTGAIAVDGPATASDAGAPMNTTPVHVGTYISSPASCTSIVGTMVTKFAPDGTSSTVSLQGTVLPVDVAVDSATGVPVVVHAATANTPEMVMPLSSVAVDATPCQFQTVPSGLSAKVSPPGQLVAIEAGDAGSFFVQTREPSTLWRSDGRTLVLSTESHADVGHAIFHADANGLACASCHPEGGEDGRVWQFTPLGPRRTPSLRGGIIATAPFHWDGDLATLSGLMNEVFVRRMQGPALASDQVDALSRWLDAIPALPAVAGDVASVARGRALFVDPQTGCATCHAGALLTNNATMDVGTGQPFQVPSLRGVAWRAPYLHDGCAATLLDRFGPCGGGDRHGHTSGLAPSALADLASYLQSL